jgi:hypothetical protein
LALQTFGLWNYTEFPYKSLDETTENPYIYMQTIVETPTFQKAAVKVGLTEGEITAVAEKLARDPEAGEMIPGSGGCRKVRVAGRGKGKSGGYRLITYYGGKDIPVYLLTIYSKGDRVNLSDQQVKAMKVFIKTAIKK